VPLTGLTTKPAIPDAVPFNMPTKPPCFLPSIGFVTTPVTPDPNEFINDLAPYFIPYIKFLGFYLIL
jgi:hypothetical protein